MGWQDAPAISDATATQPAAAQQPAWATAPAIASAPVEKPAWASAPTLASEAKPTPALSPPTQTTSPPATAAAPAPSPVSAPAGGTTSLTAPLTVPAQPKYGTPAAAHVGATQAAESALTTLPPAATGTQRAMHWQNEYNKHLKENNYAGDSETAWQNRESTRKQKEWTEKPTGMAHMTDSDLETQKSLYDNGEQVGMTPKLQQMEQEYNKYRESWQYTYRKDALEKERTQANADWHKNYQEEMTRRNDPEYRSLPREFQQTIDTIMDRETSRVNSDRSIPDPSESIKQGVLNNHLVQAAARGMGLKPEEIEATVNARIGARVWHDYVAGADERAKIAAGEGEKAVAGLTTGEKSAFVAEKFLTTVMPGGTNFFNLLAGPGAWESIDQLYHDHFPGWSAAGSIGSVAGFAAQIPLLGGVGVAGKGAGFGEALMKSAGLGAVWGSGDEALAIAGEFAHGRKLSADEVSERLLTAGAMGAAQFGAMHTAFAGLGVYLKPDEWTQIIKSGEIRIFKSDAEARSVMQTTMQKYLESKGVKVGKAELEQIKMCAELGVKNLQHFKAANVRYVGPEIKADVGEPKVIPTNPANEATMHGVEPPPEAKATAPEVGTVEPTAGTAPAPSAVPEQRTPVATGPVAVVKTAENQAVSAGVETTPKAETKPDLKSMTDEELQADANMHEDKATRDAAWQELDRRQHPPVAAPAAPAEKVSEKSSGNSLQSNAEQGNVGGMKEPTEAVEAKNTPASPPPKGDENKGPVLTYKRDNPPQVAQTLSLGKGEVNEGHQVLKGKLILVPGFEEYKLVAVPPHGSKANHNKSSWSVYEQTTGTRVADNGPIFTDDWDTMERAVGNAKQKMERFGKAELDSRIEKKLSENSSAERGRIADGTKRVGDAYVAPPESPAPVVTPLKTWLSGFDAKTQARYEAALTKQRSINKQPTTQAEYVEKAVADGAEVKVRKNGRRCIEMPDGRFLYESDLSKVALDYADHLIAEKPEGKVAAPENAPKAGVGLPPEDHLEQAIKAVQDEAKAASGDTAKGAVNIKPVVDAVAGAGKKAVAGIIDIIHYATQDMFPRLGKINTAAKDALCEMIGARATSLPQAKVWAAGAVPRVDRRFGQGFIDPVLRVKVGALLVENRLRGIRNEFKAQGNQQAANDVKTIIGVKDSPFATDAEYQAAWQDPQVQQALDHLKTHAGPTLEAHYKEAEQLNPGHFLPAKGERDVGFHMSLSRVDPGTKRSVTTGGTKGSDVRGDFRKGSPFARKATGTGDAYTIDLVEMLANQYKQNAEPALINRAIDALVKSGDAKVGPSRSVQTLNGHEVKAIQIDSAGRTFLPVEEKGDIQDDNVFSTPRRYVFVREDMYPELMNAIGKSAPKPDELLAGAAGVLNHAAVTSLVEPSAHIANQVSKLVKDAPSHVAGFVGHVFRGELPDVIRDIAGQITDDPAIQAKMVEIGKLGALRAHSPAEEGVFGGNGPLVLWRKATGGVISTIDTTVRLMTKQMTDRSGKPLTDAQVRNKINELGQYDMRAQHAVVAALRRCGMSQFVTAGIAFNSLGVKSLVSPKALMGAGAILGTAAAVNSARFGDPLGHPGVPIGSIYLGPGEQQDQDGKVRQTVRYINLFGFHPLSRGLRVTGMSDIAEHIRETQLEGGDKKTWAQVADRSAEDAIQGWLTPFLGPPGRVGLVAISGHSDLTGEHREADHAKKGESQKVENLKAAVLEINPTVKKAVTGRGSWAGRWGVQERKLPKSSSSRVPGVPKAAVTLPKIKMPK